jgi:hypothetical protein
MILRYLNKFAPGLDWQHIFHRVRSLRLPHLLINDFSLVQKITRVYFLFSWRNIQSQWGGWQCVRHDTVKEYRLQIDRVEIVFTIIEPIHTRAGVPTRRRVSVRCRDARTEEHIGPRYDFGVSVRQFLSVLSWADLYNQSHK